MFHVNHECKKNKVSFIQVSFGILYKDSADIPGFIMYRTEIFLRRIDLFNPKLGRPTSEAD